MADKKFYISGDEWLYYRIYCGRNTADKLLFNNIFPLMQSFIAENAISIWFFIRYADPDPHLRVRMKLIGNEKIGGIIEGMNKELAMMAGDDRIWKVEIGTYQPEYERYGKLSMPFIEKLFFHDSRAYCALQQSTTKANGDISWLYALISADQLLNDFGFSTERKKDLLLYLSRSFGKEFGKDKALARQLSEKFRSSRQRIVEIMSREPASSSDEIMFAILSQRSNNDQKEIKNILGLYDSGSMEVKMDDLLASLIHMSMNRLFISNNRMHEMVIYDLLHRYYRMQMSRNWLISAPPG